MRPEAHVWRKDARRDRRGRKRQTVPSVNSSKAIRRRILRFHDARRSGLTIEAAAELIGVPWMEAWRYEDFINALLDDLKGGRS